MHAARGGMHASCRHTHDLHSSNECLLQVPAAVRRDLEALTAASGSAAVLVKEAATIAKYRLPGLAATLEVCSAFRGAALEQPLPFPSPPETPACCSMLHHPSCPMSLQAIEEARDAAKLCVLRFLAEVRDS